MGPGAVSPAEKPAWKVELTRLGPYLVGVCILFPALQLVAVNRLGRASKAGVEASGLVTAWLLTIFLLVLLAPYFLNRTAWNNLRARSILEGGGRVLGLIVVSLILSFALAPGGETDVVLNVVNFHIFLLVFALVLASVFYLTQTLGLGGLGGQIAATLLGLAMIGTVLYFNPLIEGEAVSAGLREVSTSVCIGANPVIVSFHNFLGVDFFHIESVYKFSALSGYPYRYPSWEGVAGAYLLASLGFILTAILAYYLRVVLPGNLMARRLLENQELKSSKISSLRETGESAFTFTAPQADQPAAVEQPPVDTAERTGPTILESLFDKPEAEAGEDEIAPAGFQEAAKPAAEPPQGDGTDWMDLQLQSKDVPAEEARGTSADSAKPVYEEPATEAVEAQIEDQALDLEAESPDMAPADEAETEDGQGAEPPPSEIVPEVASEPDVAPPAPSGLFPPEGPYLEMETRAMDEEELEHARTSWRERADSNEPSEPEPHEAGIPLPPEEPYREMETRAMDEEELEHARSSWRERAESNEPPKPEADTEGEPDPLEGPYREMETRDMTDVVERITAGEPPQTVGPASQVSGFEPYREMETRDMTGDVQALEEEPSTPAEEPAPPAEGEEPRLPEEEPPAVEREGREPSSLTRLLAREDGLDEVVEPEPQPALEPEEEAEAQAVPEPEPEPEPEPAREQISPDTPVLPREETSRLGILAQMLGMATGDLDSIDTLADRPPPESKPPVEQPPVEQPPEEQPPEEKPSSPRMDTDRLGTLVQMLTGEETGARKKDASAEEDDAGGEEASDEDGASEGEEAEEEEK